MSHANARTNVFAGQLMVREDEVTARLDEWIATLANPEDLARGQDVDPAAGTGYAGMQRQLREANAKVAALVTALESRCGRGGLDRCTASPHGGARRAEGSP
ncbi:hypothetical protein MM1218R_03173 [Mycobacterium marinum]|nr:hypothetical protein MM1218R_03173 [Mycobacterium marinum]AXN50441.1 hypothetical protein CCUG20998_03037 [Mycobacterium marinum]RFZ09458.1 hypothetical protein DE4381_02018 [Mycobacterium marinum]RFZ28242.1 hypothetical protein DSM43519_00551 [Mycobacterium marinum]RFZ30843.1 hypothetical protein DSM44344_00090 [Mycobacterium marinum]